MHAPNNSGGKEEHKEWSEAREHLERDGAMKAIGYLTGQADSDAIMAGYMELVKYTYWELKNLATTVQLAKAGIAWCLDCADRSLDKDESEIVNTRKNAKALAYDLGSYCWSGWDEIGITITHADQEVGTLAAEQCLSRVKQLQQGDVPMARALWLLAAHQLTS